jgi:ribosomal protection tetracycline resistance protein
MLALERARTAVCEPIVRLSIETPPDSIGAIFAATSRLGGVVGTPSRHHSLAAVNAMLPADRAQDLRRQLPRLTGGEGIIESSFGGYQPVRGLPPTRQRSTVNPLDRDTYLARVARRASGSGTRRDTDN